MRKCNGIAVKVLSVICTAAMVFTSVSTGVYAAEQPESAVVAEEAAEEATEEAAEAATSEEAAGEETEEAPEEEQETEEAEAPEEEEAETPAEEPAAEEEESEAPDEEEEESAEEAETAEEGTTEAPAEEQEEEVSETEETVEEDTDEEAADGATTIEIPDTSVVEEPLVVEEGKEEDLATDLAQYFDYDIKDDGTAAITDYSGTEANITIPSKIDGFKVTEIGEKAFSCNDTITTVVIPSGVVSLGVKAFTCCRNLKKVTLPTSVIKIEQGCFSFCDVLTTINLSSVKEIGYDGFWMCDLSSIELSGSIKTIEKRVFGNNEALKSVDIPANVVTIEEGAFGGCSLTKVTFHGTGLKTIGDGAFSSNNLTSLTIPAGVTSLHPNAIKSNDMGWDVDPANKSYCSVGGVLFNKSMTELYDYPRFLSASVYTIPDTVTTVKEFAFSMAPHSLKKIIIPASVKVLEKGSLNIFYNELMIYRFYGAAPEIDDEAFVSDGDTRVWDVYYPASEKSWATLRKNTNDPRFTGAMWHPVGADAAAPKLTTPVISSIKSSATGITVTWKRVPDAQYYSVYCKSSKSGWKKIGATKYTTFTTKTWNGTNAFRDKNYYYFKIVAQAKNDVLKKVYSSPNVNKGTGKLFLKAPTIKSYKSTAAKKLTLNWSKYTGTGCNYVIQYSRLKNFRYSTKTLTIKNASTVSKTITTDKSGDYYVRIRAKFRRKNGTTAYTPWSVVKKVTVK